MQDKDFEATIQKIIAAYKNHPPQPQTQKETVDVVKDVMSHPGAARGDIAKRVGLRPKLVSKCLADLHREGKIVKLGDKKWARWFAAETVELLMRHRQH